MKTLVAIPILLLALGQTGYSQITLNAGDTYVHSFSSLPGPTDYRGPADAGGSVYFTLSPGSLQASNKFTIEMFEDTLAGAPILSRATTGAAELNPFAGYVPGAWRDLQGAVRLSVTEGSVTLNQVQVISFFYGGGFGIIYYSSTFVPVPSPRLTISRAGSSSAQITWATNFIGYALEYTTNLSAVVWSPTTNAVSTISNRFSVTVDTPTSQRVYRLRKP